MFAAATLGLVMLTPAAHGAQPAAKPDEVDRSQAATFAYLVHQLAARIDDGYAIEHKDRVKDLIEGAVRGLYEEAGVPLPDAVRDSVRRCATSTDFVNVLVEARVKLGNVPALGGARALFAAIGGFRHAIDPACVLACKRPVGQERAAIDQDFGIGIELEGATGPGWARYQVEFETATGWLTPAGWFGPVPKPEAVQPPCSVPWRVKRVIPGSPAQAVGVRAGDAITHLDGTEITAANAPRLFAEFAYPPAARRQGITIPLGLSRKLTFSRPGGKPAFTTDLVAGLYTPECVFGVTRRDEETWDCMLDRDNRIGYIRLGPIEENADARLDVLVADLVSRQCRGLVFDLRWCPGGWVSAATRLAGLFLPRESILARMEYRHPDRFATAPVMRTLANPRYPDLPILLLVGAETTGGGELIAAALQDNKRVATMGQRTVGRAFIQNVTDAGFGNLNYKLSVGVSYRPNGKPRQRLPDSQPVDDWGVRPDVGLEVPVTLDLSKELRLAAEVQALRPAGSKEALPFDDYEKDPYRLAAVTYFRKKFAN